MINRILGSDITYSFSLGDDLEARLYPQELDHVKYASECRKREFATTRSLARRALQKLGFPPGPILSGPMREPVWPEGVVGSITHCHGFRAVAVANSGRFRAIGIDAEPHEKLPEGVLREISIQLERDWLEQAPDGTHWDRLLFCAKESVYKAWFPLTKSWLGFNDALVTISPRDNSFAVGILNQPDATIGLVPTKLTGRFLIEAGFILTAVVLTV